MVLKRALALAVMIAVASSHKVANDEPASSI
jgi:hypothetical protein